MLCIERREACGHTDSTGDRVELGDHHAVLGRDDVWSDDRRKLIAKSFHSAIGQQTFRFSLVKVSRDPGWLETSYTVEIEAVQGSIQGQELRPELMEEFYLIVREQERCDGNTPGRRGRSGFRGRSLSGQRRKETSVTQLVTDDRATV